MSMNIFEKASKWKLRFDTSKGQLSTEDLWDLSLISLDSLAKSVSKKLKEESEESFISEKSTANTELELRLDILKHVIDVKLKEKEASKSRAERRAKIETLENLLERKRTQELEGKSSEELLAEIEALKAEV